MMWRQSFQSSPTERQAGLALVVALHAVALWSLWQHRWVAVPVEFVTLFANIVAPPLPEKRAPDKPPPPKRAEQPPPQRLVATVRDAAPSDLIASPPQQEPEPVKEIPVPAPLPAGPMALAGELSVACPERTPPRYPPISRRLSEEGLVVLRVELDERGLVCAAHIATSSGFTRLDEAAIAAVRSWRCTPAQREGRPVRAVAVQPFKFVLQGS